MHRWLVAHLQALDVVLALSEPLSAALFDFFARSGADGVHLCCVCRRMQRVRHRWLLVEIGGLQVRPWRLGLLLVCSALLLFFLLQLLLLAQCSPPSRLCPRVDPISVLQRLGH